MRMTYNNAVSEANPDRASVQRGWLLGWDTQRGVFSNVNLLKLVSATRNREGTIDSRSHA